MNSKHALKGFQRYLTRNGDRRAPKTPALGFARMLGFYKTARFDDVNLADAGDMLLFQWGIYDLRRRPWFEVDLTRQLIRGDAEDDDIWQLHLTYRFVPDEVLRELGHGDRWCRGPDDLPEFEAFVMGHPALARVGVREDGRVKIDYECAG